MQRLLFEKSIDLNHHLSELISINVDDHLAYTQETNGMRATGELEISGEYLKNVSRERFNDTIALDIFAPQERRDCKEEFYLEVSDFDYRIQSGNLFVEVTVLCHGILEKDDKRVEIVEEDEDEQALIEELKEMIEPDKQKDELKAAIEEQLARQDNENNMVKETSKTIEMVNESIGEEVDDRPFTEQTTQEVPIENKIDSTSLLVASQEETEIEAEVKDESVNVEDLFDDDADAYVVYRIYVVNPGDTYESIALHYGIDEMRLSKFHHDAPLVAHQLLLIPDQNE